MDLGDSWQVHWNDERLNENPHADSPSALRGILGIEDAVNPSCDFVVHNGSVILADNVNTEFLRAMSDWATRGETTYHHVFRL